MKMLYLLLTLFLLPITFAFPQEGWFWQNPKPQSNDLWDSYFLDQYNGWAVGVYGACINTTDGGETWQRISLPIHSNLASVYFIDTQKGFIGDWDGNLLTTTDGGINWSVTYLDEFANIYIYFIDVNNGWILSSSPPINTYKVYRTIDGGANWEPHTINSSNVLYDIFFTDTNVGFVVGGFGDIFRTTDSGINWVKINSPVTEFLHKIYFKNLHEGFIVGSDGVFLETTDGGLNWTNRYVGYNRFWDISFYDSSNGIMIANGPTIYITSDGGVNWIDKSINTIRGYMACNYLTENECITFGSIGNIFKSTNNGSSWTSKIKGNRNTISDMTFIDLETGFTVGDNGSILRTMDRGETWKLLSPVTNESLTSIFFSDEQNGWIVGSNSVLFRTSNGGQNWILDSIPNAGNLRSVYFIDNMTGWAAGEYNIIFKTTDGGESWVQQELSIGHTITLNSISMINENVGYVCGFYRYFYPPVGIIFKTTDGGLNWNVNKTESVEQFNSIFFKDSFDGWVVGEWKTFRTTDGGNSWIHISNTGGNDIYFMNSEIGIQVGNHTLASFIFITSDGGENWIEQPTVTDRYLYTTYVDENGYWGAGFWGSILYSEDPILSGIIDNPKSEIFSNNFYISQNYPNPFNPKTSIKYELPAETFVSIKIYDVLGNEVATLLNKLQQMGNYEVVWDATNFASGIYLYKLQTEKFVTTKKMILIK